MLITSLPARSAFICIVASAIIIAACTNDKPEKEEDNIMEIRNEEQGNQVERGSYLVTAGHCYDCHTPKKMTAQGPVDDSSKTLAGHLAGTQLPPLDEKALQPGYWAMIGPDLMTWVGPWGISYPANLTPDSATGIGAWTEEVFIKTLRTGKHLGQENGRPILPPMPWYNLAKMTDADLQAIYAYLRTIPPVSNRVPEPMSPADATKLARSRTNTSGAVQSNRDTL